MKHFPFISLIACAVCFAGCASDETAGGAETSRAAQNAQARQRAAQQEQQQAPMDEGTQNLWSAQQNILRRGGDPSRYGD